MQITRNLKHIFFVSTIIFLMIFGTIRFFAPFVVPTTHFFVYRENIIPLNWLYKYEFKPSNDIAIIKIDDTTLNTLQSKSDLKYLSIPKSIYGDLITKLESVWVKGVAFDIVFQNIDPEEQTFADILERSPNVVIATSRGEKMKCSIKKTFDDKHTERYDRLGNLCKINASWVYESPAWSCMKDKDGKHETCDGVPRSIYQGAKWWYIGLDEWYNDRTFAVLGTDDTPYVSWKNSKQIDTLSLALYKTSIDADTVIFWRDTLALIPFFGKAWAYPSISLADVLSMNKVDLISNFAGKYVFVWESGWLIHDAHRSPVTGDLMDGVEFHAHFLDGILKDRQLREFSINDFSFFLGLVLLLWFMTTIFFVASKFLSVFIAVLITLCIIWMGRYVYFSYGIVLEILPLLLAGSIFTFPITFIYRFFVVDREKRILSNAFAHYVDPELVKEIADSADFIKLGGESRELSILFSDIAWFTTISEKTPVKELFSLMSSYLSRMTGILTENGGTLDKYIGDAVMGFFGAPLIQEDHAKRACHTALDMREALPAFNEWLLTQSLEAIDFRVGIGSGEVMVGNIGSEDRFNYTVLGDTVNLASRLEGISKEYGTHIIVSEATYMMTKEVFLFRKLDLITVKGKDRAVGIYELIADIRDKTIDTTKYDQYERALELYMKWNYLDAGKLWESQFGDDPPSRIMAHRCLDILKGDLIVEDGVYHMTKK